jgi:hypothetical protein
MVQVFSPFTLSTARGSTRAQAAVNRYYPPHIGVQLELCAEAAQVHCHRQLPPQWKLQLYHEKLLA